MNRTPDEIKKGLECCVIGPSAHQPKCGECPYKFVPMCSDTFLKDAFALIQQLQDENTEKDEKICQLEAQNAELLTKVEQLQAERDAAVADVKSLCATNYFSGDYCVYCKHCEPDGQCHHPCKPYSNEWGWEWRGVQKEDGNV